MQTSQDLLIEIAADTREALTKQKETDKRLDRIEERMEKGFFGAIITIFVLISWIIRPVKLFTSLLLFLGVK